MSLSSGETYVRQPYYTLVGSLSDLPTPSGNVITLEAEKTYVFTTVVDLGGNRLVCGENTTILGGSSENCRIKSTGLVGSALITSTYSLPIRNITIEADIALDLDGNGYAGAALDWFGVNFTNCTTVGTIKNYTNFIMSDSAFLNSQGMTFDGTIGTIAFFQCLFDCSALGTVISVPNTATITRRIRVNYSSFVVLAGETGINISGSATIPTEGYILDTVNFSGGGTYTTGVTYADNKALWINCRGVVNSGNIAQYYMSSNATATTVLATNTFYKVAGTTTSGAYVEKFTLTNNKAEYTGALTGFYKVTAILTIESGNNNQVRIRIAKDGTTSAQSESKTTTNGSGRSENVMVQDIIEIATGAYIEIFVANASAITNITVVDMNVVIERLN